MLDRYSLETSPEFDIQGLHADRAAAAGGQEEDQKYNGFYQLHHIQVCTWRVSELARDVLVYRSHDCHHQRSCSGLAGVDGIHIPRRGFVSLSLTKVLCVSSCSPTGQRRATLPCAEGVARARFTSDNGLQPYSDARGSTDQFVHGDSSNDRIQHLVGFSDTISDIS